MHDVWMSSLGTEPGAYRVAKALMVFGFFGGFAAVRGAELNGPGSANAGTSASELEPEQQHISCLIDTCRLVCMSPEVEACAVLQLQPTLSKVAVCSCFQQ